MKQELINNVEQLSSKALRCLALSYTENCGSLSDYDGPNHPSHKLLEDYSNF
jgi:hypothetical protein